MKRKLLILYTLSLFATYSLIGQVYVRQVVPDSTEAGQYFDIMLQIIKPNISGISRIQYDLPAGFSPYTKDNNGATFLAEENVVKLIWMSIPTEDSITVTFTVNVDQAIKGIHKLSGLFSYVGEEAKISIDIPIKEIYIVNTSEPVTIYALPDSTALLANNSDSLTQSIIDGTLDSATSKINEPVDTIPVVKETTPEPPKTNYSGIIYRIQILASSKQLEQEYFKTNMGLNDYVYMSLHGAMYKYAVGDFSKYDAALEYKSSLNIKGCFMIAYDGSKKIPLSEARTKE